MEHTKTLIENKLYNKSDITIMAKKNLTAKNKNFGDAVGISNIISSRQADYILGGILAVASIFSIIAMFSFLKTCGSDQSILEHLRPGEWLNEKGF